MDRVLSALPSPAKRSGSGWAAKCPGHDDRQASLTIGEGQDGRALVSCHAGCSSESVVALLGLTMADLFAEHDRPTVAPTLTRHEIRDAGGQLVAIHERTDSPDGKRFRWLRPDGAVGLAGVPTASLPLYGAERVKDSPTIKPTILCEGEKAADALTRVRRHALGTVTGAAGTPSAESLAILAGRDVILWPDADEPGREHMHRIAPALEGVARSVRWLEIPGASKGADAADLLGLADDPLAALREVAAYVSDVPTPLPAERDVPSGTSRGPLFRTAREITLEAPATWHYIVRPWLAAGTITELDGKPKAAGKTTWLLHLIRAALDGARFLGEPTERTPVVLLSEQSRASLAPTLRQLGLDRDDLIVLTWPDAMGLAWGELAAAAVRECERIGARLLIVDTLGQFAGIRGDAENDAGAALEAMAPLQAATANGLAVLVSRHDRKSGGEVGESGRGSNAWTGAVDCVLNLRRQSNPVRGSIRELEAISRRSDVPAEPVLIELTDAGYAVLGSEEAVAVAEAKAGLLAYLADSDARTEKEILEALGEGVRRTTLQAARDVLIGDGHVVRLDRAKGNEPYRYSLTSPGSRRLLPDLESPSGSRRQTTPATDDQTILATAQRLFGSNVA